MLRVGNGKHRALDRSRCHDDRWIDCRIENARSFSQVVQLSDGHSIHHELTHASAGQ